MTPLLRSCHFAALVIIATLLVAACKDEKPPSPQRTAGPGEVAEPCGQAQAEVINLERPFTRRGGKAYVASLPILQGQSDSLEAPSRSRWLLCENGKVLGPAHSIHDEIGEKGGGRFSHWQTGVIFSSSDQSDPNSNGYRYWVVQPANP